MKTIRMENRASTGTRLVTIDKIYGTYQGEPVYYTFEIGYHFPKKKYYVEEAYTYRKAGKGSYGGTVFLSDTIKECINYIQNKHKVRIVLLDAMVKNPEGGSMKKTKRGLGFWIPVAVVTCGLGYIAYKVFKKPPVPSSVRKGIIKVTPYVSRVGTSDESRWRLDIENLTQHPLDLSLIIIPEILFPTVDLFNFKGYTMSKNINMGPAGYIPSFYMGRLDGNITIKDNSKGTISVKDTKSGDEYYRADYLIDVKVYDKAINNNYVVPVLKKI